MDFFNNFNFTDYVPQAVIVAVVIVILMVNTTIAIAAEVERILEEKKGKQIRFFDHKKIWLSFFWSIIASVILACCSFIAWKQLPFYLFVILGGSSFFYETVIKKFGKSDDQRENT